MQIFFSTPQTTKCQLSVNLTFYQIPTCTQVPHQIKNADQKNRSSGIKLVFLL
jgi:hypothetical protein